MQSIHRRKKTLITLTALKINSSSRLKDHRLAMKMACASRNKGELTDSHAETARHQKVAVRRVLNKTLIVEIPLETHSAEIMIIIQIGNSVNGIKMQVKKCNHIVQKI